MFLRWYSRILYLRTRNVISSWCTALFSCMQTLWLSCVSVVRACTWASTVNTPTHATRVPDRAVRTAAPAMCVSPLPTAALASGAPVPSATRLPSARSPSPTPAIRTPVSTAAPALLPPSTSSPAPALRVLQVNNPSLLSLLGFKKVSNLWSHGF